VDRLPFVVGNWKMNTTRDEATRLAGAIAAAPSPGVEVAVCPPFPWLVPVADAVRASHVLLGAQDCWTEKSGAFTGAVSPVMLAELCHYVIIGHSERRRIFDESDELVARKVTAALDAGLGPILCVGEDLETRRAGRASTFVRSQLEVALADRPAEAFARITVAYEPIWAIGTGVAAEPADAEEMCRDVRDFIRVVADNDAANSVRVLYGGSVTAANCAEIQAGANVDGSLVGGASLRAESFLAIVAAARH
jgi:triosephosphate isomerase (TIM)